MGCIDIGLRVVNRKLLAARRAALLSSFRLEVVGVLAK